MAILKYKKLHNRPEDGAELQSPPKSFECPSRTTRENVNEIYEPGYLLPSAHFQLVSMLKERRANLHRQRVISRTALSNTTDCFRANNHSGTPNPMIESLYHHRQSISPDEGWNYADRVGWWVNQEATREFFVTHLSVRLAKNPPESNPKPTMDHHPADRNILAQWVGSLFILCSTSGPFIFLDEAFFLAWNKKNRNTLKNFSLEVLSHSQTRTENRNL